MDTITRNSDNILKMSLNNSMYYPAYRILMGKWVEIHSPTHLTL